MRSNNTDPRATQYLLQHNGVYTPTVLYLSTLMAWLLCATSLLWLRCSSVRLHASNFLIKCREKPDVKHSASTLDRTSVRAPLPRSQSASICLSYFTSCICTLSWKSVSVLSLTLDYCCCRTQLVFSFILQMIARNMDLNQLKEKFTQT